MADVDSSYRKILDRIAAAAAKARRDPREIRVLAAAKSQSIGAIRAAIASGVALIGENYVQEAKETQRQILGAHIEWHMIGHLQRNKAKVAVELFDLIESLDSLTLARELAKEAAKQGRVARTFVEVNLAGEESKTGIAKTEVAYLLERMAELAHIQVEGLMTIPPFRENSEEVRPYFRELRELRDKLSAVRLPNVKLQELSMGMSHDYSVAIEEGATIVRIGTALFGARRE